MRSSVTSRSEVLGRLREHGDDLRDLGVESLALFGSFGRDAASSTSDVDFVVEFRPGAKSFDRFMDLNFLLEEILGRNVEVVTRESLDKRFAQRIADDLHYVDESRQPSRRHA